MKILLISLILVAACQAQNLDGVKFTFYGADLSDTQSIDLSNAATFSQLTTPYYDPARPNVIFIQGMEPADSSGTRDIMMTAYLTARRAEFNIIYLDWGQYSQTINFISVVGALNPVTATANQILAQMKAQGFDLTKTHVIGFSFGVIIAGGIGRYWRTQQPSIKLRRITALDPPEFYLTMGAAFALAGVTKLSINDANFVDVIHTNTAQLGDGFTYGKANFWPNSGYIQPACSSYSQAAAGQPCKT